MDGYLREKQQTLAMLNKNKILYGILLGLMLLIFSCKQNRNNEILKQTSLLKSYSTNIVGEKLYRSLYDDANDSLKLWVKNKLQSYLQLTSNTWELDPLICFSKQGNKCVMGILVQDEINVSNAVDFFYGVKINSQWYFFSGATCYPTPYNDKGKLSFSKLHEIAMQEVFSGYLIRKQKDAGFWKNLFAPEYEYEVNERFFDFENKNQSGEGYGSCLKCKTFEEYVLYLVGENWKKR